MRIHVTLRSNEPRPIAIRTHMSPRHTGFATGVASQTRVGQQPAPRIAPGDSLSQVSPLIIQRTSAATRPEGQVVRVDGSTVYECSASVIRCVGRGARRPADQARRRKSWAYSTEKQCRQPRCPARHLCNESLRRDTTDRYRRGRPETRATPRPGQYPGRTGLDAWGCFSS